MPIQSVYLDWSHAALPAAADWLVNRFANSAASTAELDLSNLIVVLPGARAERRLLELLSDRAIARRQILLPPRLVTLGALPELLYVAQKPFASPVTQQAVWVKVLRDLPDNQIRDLVKQVPPRDNWPAWWTLAELIARLHRELAADDLDFRAAFATARKLPDFAGELRWNRLCELQAAYLRALDALQLWDAQTARRVAIRQHEFRTSSQVVLIGTVDLNSTQRRMLDQIASQVTTVVFCDPDHTTRFDEYGCLLADRWCSLVSLPALQQIEILPRAADQGNAVCKWLSQLDDSHTTADVTIGVPDEALIPIILQRCAEAGVPARFGPGRPIEQSSFCRFIAAVADLLQDQRIESLTALLRHPFCVPILSRRGVNSDFLTRFDTLVTEQLPARIPKVPATAADCRGPVEICIRAIHEYLEPLGGLTQSSRKQSPVRWGSAIAGWLISVGELESPVSNTTVTACRALLAEIDDLNRIDAALLPKLSSSEFLRLLLYLARRHMVPAEHDAAAIELLGWLELPLDDAPALCIASCNDGLIPASRSSDPFLSEPLRRALQLDDDSRRLARDAYALSHILASPRKVHLLASRRSVDQDPLLPSRFLLGDDPSELPDRVTRLISDAAASTARSVLLSGSIVSGVTVTNRTPPKPHRLELKSQPLSLRVTEFRDYLACPYRYFLRHRLKLRTVDDAANELTSAAFGTLLHQVLAVLGRNSSIANSTDPAFIATELKAELDRLSRDTFGESPRSVLALQVEQIRLRIDRFAEWQAEWRREGHQVLHTEWESGDVTPEFLSDFPDVSIRGRIDRIDYNSRTESWTILDYKTGDTPASPTRSHRRSDMTWVDLQLPLYRHLASQLELPGEPALGYLVLPREVDKTGFLSADWTNVELQSADLSALQVVRGILAENFAMSSEPVSGFDELSVICQDSGALAGLSMADDDDEQDDD